MPDLTLYRDDAQRIRVALRIAAARLEKQGSMGEAENYERISDLIIDRMVQGLHPERPTRETKVQLVDDAGRLVKQGESG